MSDPPHLLHSLYSSLDCPHFYPHQGRGVPEIDILETRPCSDLARMGGTLAAAPAAGTCGLSTLQVAPRLPDYLRPQPTYYPDEATSWYRDLLEP